MLVRAGEREEGVRRPLVKATGYVLFGLVVIGLALTVMGAALSGQPFYGLNYKGLPLGAYSTLAVLALAAVVVLTAGVSRALASARRRSAKSHRM